jgi:hypothetical protein
LDVQDGQNQQKGGFYHLSGIFLSIKCIHQESATLILSIDFFAYGNLWKNTGDCHAGLFIAGTV